MNLLDNELIRKYFGCDNDFHGHSLKEVDCAVVMADRILQAMQEPIRKGDGFLFVGLAGYVREKDQSDHVADFTGSFHPNYLRLPDKFQPKTDKVEEKIKRMCERTSLLSGYITTEPKNLEVQLRELVKLVKEGE